MKKPFPSIVVILSVLSFLSPPFFAVAATATESEVSSVEEEGSLKLQRKRLSTTSRQHMSTTTNNANEHKLSTKVGRHQNTYRSSPKLRQLTWKFDDLCEEQVSCGNVCFEAVDSQHCPKKYEYFFKVYWKCGHFVPLGSLCEGDGECGTNDQLHNCNFLTFLDTRSEEFPIAPVSYTEEQEAHWNWDHLGGLTSTDVYRRVPCCAMSMGI